MSGAGDSGPAFSVGCYNVLCSTYAVKWGEREGVGHDGASNWPARWPVLRDIIARANWDVVCLQEVESTDAPDIAAGLEDTYVTRYFKHAKRPPDGVLIAVKRAAFKDLVFTERQFNGVAFGRVDMVHEPCSSTVCVVTCHARGGNEEQLGALAAFADEGGGADVTVVAGDFNEDFCAEDRRSARCPLPETAAGAYETLLREGALPQLSRPPHKQAEDQKSGKGKVDWIFVRGRAPRCSVALFRDEASHAAVLESHQPCAATGQWPSDHGAEALSVRVVPAVPAAPADL